MVCTQRVKWQSLGTTKWEIYVNREKYFVISFLLKLCIILHCSIDDVQDNSILRRGIPAAHTIYGIPSTINAATYAHFVTLKRVQSLNHPKAMALCTEHLSELYHGQGMEIYWRDNYTCPSVEEYQQIAKRSKDRVRIMSRI
jgi:geranylgeranyl diphosphate synthase type 3